MDKCALAVLLLALGACSPVVVVHGLDAHEASRAQSWLQREGVSATRQTDTTVGDGRFQLAVASDQVAHAQGVLRALDLPGDDAASDSSWLPTRTSEQRRRRREAERALTRTLVAIDSMLSARVHVALPEDHGLLDANESAHPSASVLLRYVGERVPVEESHVRRLVAAAVDGVREQDVAVVAMRQSLPIRTRDETVMVLGLWRVSRADSTSLKAVLAVSWAVLTVLVVMGLLRLARRQRRDPSMKRPTTSSDGT